MPFPEIQEKAGKKRKRNDPRHNGEAEPSRKASSKKSNKSKDGEKKIQTLENGILESRRNYNDILELVAIAKDHSTPETSVSASVSLCRIFGTLMASGSFTKSRTTPESELVIVKWLKSQYAEYTGHLLGVLCGENRQGREIALELIMRLVKEETVHSSHLGDQIWKTGIFANAVRTIVGSWASTGDVIDLFVRSYLVNYDDVRYWTFSAVA